MCRKLPLSRCCVAKGKFKYEMDFGEHLYISKKVDKFAQVASDKAQLKNLGLPSSVRTRDMFN